ncbi:MAG: biotin-dependent carboxyltransferase family protein, partial [Verrucomicrobiota bacterium]
MSEAIFEVLDPGFGLTIQDGGRHGWRRFGVPPSGAMDDHAAAWANRLLDNPDDAPVLELPLQGVRLRVLNSAWIAVTGANACPNIPMWRAIHVQREDIIHFPRNTSGVWIYLAVAGGFEAERWLGSASVYPRGLLGRACASGARLSRRTGHGNFRLPDHVAGRIAAFAEQRHYDSPPAIRVWPGPQWDSFLPEERAKFFSQQWTVTARSDRVGYRLAGEAVHANPIEILSEPVL